jgi:23S rRNA-/tRNA-specific pseudouridylate synthase
MHDYPDTDSDDNFDAPDDSLRHHEFVVEEEQAGQRLDRYLAAQFPDVSRTHVRALIDEGRVRVSGIAKKPAHHLESGETITVEIPAPPPPGVEPEDIPLTILYEDEDIAIVNKPAGMIVHPGAGADTGTLVAALLIASAWSMGFRALAAHCVRESYIAWTRELPALWSSRATTPRT